MTRSANRSASRSAPSGRDCTEPGVRSARRSGISIPPMRPSFKEGISTMDELMLLRDMPDDVAPPTPEAMSAARSRLNEAVSAAHRSPLAERLRPWSRTNRLRPRRLLRLALACGLALALSIGTALALQPAGHGHGHGTARL